VKKKRNQKPLLLLSIVALALFLYVVVGLFWSGSPLRSSSSSKYVPFLAMIPVWIVVASNDKKEMHHRTLLALLSVLLGVCFLFGLMILLLAV